MTAIKEARRERDQRGNAGRRADRHHRAGRARQRNRARPRDGDRAQSRARGASRHGARNRDRLAVSLDLEVDGKLSLRAAHEMADGLESAIAAELGAGRRGRNPYRAAAAAGRRRPRGAARARAARCAMALAEIAAEGRVVRDVHDVRVRETDDGEIVNFHCRVDPTLTVQAVHEKVDDARARADGALVRDQARDRPRRADDVAKPSRFQSAGRPRPSGRSNRPACAPTPPSPSACTTTARPTGWWRRSHLDVSLHPTRNARARDARAQAQSDKRPRRPLVLDGDGLYAGVAQARRHGAAAGQFSATPDRLTIPQPPQRAVHAGDRDAGRSHRQHAALRASTARAAPIARSARPKASAASPISPTGRT